MDDIIPDQLCLKCQDLASWKDKEQPKECKGGCFQALKRTVDGVERLILDRCPMLLIGHLEDTPLDLRINCQDFKNWDGKKQPGTCKDGCLHIVKKTIDGIEKVQIIPCVHLVLEFTDAGALSPVHPIELGDTVR